MQFIKYLGRPAFHILLIALIGLIVYSNTLNTPFQWDEGHYIVENPLVKDLRYFVAPDEAKKFPLYDAYKNRYVGYLTFALNYKINGLDVTGYHIFNISVHILNAILVYLLATLTFKTPFMSGSRLKEHSGPIAFFSSLLFVSHPIQTEAVTYVFQRLASLAAFFYLLSLVSYVYSRICAGKKRRYLYYALSLFSAVLAMKTKENAFTLPIVIALYEFSFFDGPIKRRIVPLIPLLFTLLIIPFSIFGTDKPIGEIISGIGKGTIGYMDIPRGDYLFTQFRVIVTYIRLLFLPINQNVDYDYPVFDSFFEPQVLLSFLFLLAILIFGFYLFRISRSRPHLRIVSFGIAWFFITLSIESSIIPIAMIMNEYRLCLPGIGVFLGFSTVAVHMLSNVSNKSFPANYRLFLLILIIPLSLAAYNRNGVWRDKISLWSDAVSKSPRKASPYNNLAAAHTEKGDYSKAVAYYREALRLDPASIGTYVNLGSIYRKIGYADAAMDMYQRAIAIDEEIAGMNYAHLNLGIIYAEKVDFKNALEYYSKALAYDPYSVDVHVNLGNLYDEMGYTDKAIRAYQKAIDIDKNDPSPYFNLAVLYENKGDLTEAAKYYKKAGEIDPKYGHSK
jgi:Flp pilus assembly protein TadD